MRKTIVMGVAAIGLLVVWAFLLIHEIVTVLDFDSEEVVRTDLRSWVMTLLTGLLGSALAMLTAADDPTGDSKLGALPTAVGVGSDRWSSVMAMVYASVYVLGIIAGLMVVLTNESEASNLLLATTSGGLGTIVTGVAAWMGLTFSVPPAPKVD